MLKASFISDSRNIYTGARCEVDGQVIEVQAKKNPAFALARALEALGYGDEQLQMFTHTGTPSLRGLVKVMAGLTVEETKSRGLRLRPYRPFNVGGGVKDEREQEMGTEHPLSL